MVIAALETVTRRGSVALWNNGVCHALSGDSARTHVERLPRELTDWIQSQGCPLEEVDTLAVVSGPGSFTGLRVGIAAVQGLALSRRTPVVAVPTLEALATSWLLGPSASDACLVTCLDGHRGEVFVAAWNVQTGRSLEDAAPVIAPCVTLPDRIAGLLAGQRTRVVIVGDGGQRYAGILKETLPQAAFETPGMSLAEAAVRMAAAHPERAVSPHALRPVYIRRPDAELARERMAAAAASTTYSIRRANIAEDLATVEALQRQTFSNPWGAESIRWELENSDVARLYVMHDGDGRLVAYCACWMVFDELHINSLAVDVTRRRRGLAKRLLEQVLREAAESGATSATLEVRSSNDAARGLYEGLGFTVEGRRRDYYQEPREDAIILWKRGMKAS